MFTFPKHDTKTKLYAISTYSVGIKDRTRPGIRLDMKKNKTLLKKLPDQFKPFENVFGCKVSADGIKCWQRSMCYNFHSEESNNEVFRCYNIEKYDYLVCGM